MRAVLKKVSYRGWLVIAHATRRPAGTVGVGSAPSAQWGDEELLVGEIAAFVGEAGGRGTVDVSVGGP